jgi:hypothetical protein
MEKYIYWFTRRLTGHTPAAMTRRILIDSGISIQDQFKIGTFCQPCAVRPTAVAMTLIGCSDWHNFNADLMPPVPFMPSVNTSHHLHQD